MPPTTPYRLDEAARLAALSRYGVLDTPPEEAFDRLTRLASTVFGVPIAFVSLIDAERQWFKSRVGVDVCETSRDVAFCEHVVQSGDALVVEDTLLDPRFVDNPFVTARPGIRFYAGAPLLMPDGHLIGTLCVLDTVPRTFTAEQLAMLTDFAAVAIDELELRREVAERRAAERALEARAAELLTITTHTEDVISRYDHARRHLYVNPTLERLTGRACAEFIGKTNTELNMPEGHTAGLEAAIEQVLRTGEPVDFSFPAGDPENPHGYMAARLVPELRDAEGRVETVLGVTRDLTALHRATAEAQARALELQAVTDNAEDTIARFDRGLRLVFANPATERMTGQPLACMLGKTYPEMGVPPHVAVEREEMLRRVFRSGSRLEYRFRATTAQGARRFHAHLLPEQRDSEGRVETVLAIARDVTEQQDAEDALRTSEARYRDVVETVRDVVFRAEIDGCWTFLNPAWERVSGYTVEESLGHRFLEYIHPDDRPDVERRARGFASGQVDESRHEVRLLTPSGETRWVEANVQRVFGPDGAWNGYAGTYHDVTERHLGEEALRKSEAETRRLADLVARTTTGIIVTDAEGRTEWVNDGFTRLSGYSLDKLVGRTPGEVLEGPDTDPRTTAEIIERMAEQVPFATEILNYHRDGTAYWVRMEVTPLTDGDRLTGFMAVETDVTQRKRAEQALRRANDDLQGRVAAQRADLALATEQLREETIQRQSHERWIEQLGTLLDRAQDAIWVLDPEGYVVYWNQSAERLYGLGYEDYAGRDVRGLVAEIGDRLHADAFAAALAHGEWSGELQHHTADGTHLDVESRWTYVPGEDDAPGRILVVNTDVTERKQLVLRAQRMESLGRLTGGIAHDINNVLGPILMSLQVLAMRTPDDAGRRLIGALEAGTQRGAGLVRQLLTYLRGVRGERALLDPTPLIDELGDLLRETFPRSVEITLEVEDGLWSVHGDPTQLDQVLMNLSINALDAMAEGGRLTITGRNHTVDAAEAEAHGGHPGTHVVLSVADTGTGIPPEAISQIFEPFFTTKEKGTGFGLATVLGIVRGHGGFLSVDSRPGEGTRFDVYLPATEEAPAAPAAGDFLDADAGQGELILVVDDNPAMREAAQAVLEAHGYSVLIAENGAEALDLHEAHNGAVCAVVTDVMMPVMDGPTMVRHLQERDPGLPVVVTSGFSDAQAVEEAAGFPVPFIAKPYTAGALLGALAEALYGPGAGLEPGGEAEENAPGWPGDSYVHGSPDPLTPAS